MVLSLLGLASGLTGWLLIEQRGPVLFSVGAAFPSRRMTTVLGALALPLIIVALATVRGRLG